MTGKERAIVDIIRKQFSLNQDVTDEDIFEKTINSLTWDLVNIGLAKEALAREINKLWPRRLTKTYSTAW